MPLRPKRIAEPDLIAWAEYVRDVNPFDGRVLPSPPIAAPSPQSQRPPPPPPDPPHRSAPQPRPNLVTGRQPPGLDNSTWNRFAGNKLPAARTLDLHGKTAQTAFHALQRFLCAAHADHLRCVEIITGRGSGEAGGVIRRELPLWLALPALRPLILATAHPHPANPGSTRVLLRRTGLQKGQERRS